MIKDFSKHKQPVTCYNCGGIFENVNTSMPFKLNNICIVIIKGLPVLQCENCNEFVIEDEIMEKVDSILEKIDSPAELEILSYAG
jgi:YgiT-type zinc finger domain-containing protein